ncbi:protein rolling stone-like [Chironomus tepperi]|uniref:protein rolling stone-like n=1 Tax=Chironomus tepperi TaxID=113505 RepID=UPI00391F4922
MRKILVFQNLKLSFETDNPKKFLKSQWQKEDKSTTFVIYRILIAIFFIFSYTNGLVVSATGNQILLSFIYLTRLNMLATAITCTIGAYYAVSFYFEKINPQNRMTLGIKFYWFMYNNIVPFSCAVSLVYWILLYGTDKDDTINLNNVLMHMTNSLVLLIDLIIVHHEHRILHFVYLLVCGTGYLAFTLIYTFLGGVNTKGQNYVYSVLDWKENPKKAVIVTFGVYFLLIVLHMIVCGIAKLKQMVHDCILVTSKNESELQVVHVNIMNPV